jgi:hypothetical protein
MVSCNEDVMDTPVKPSEDFNDVDAMPFASDSVDVLIAGAVNARGEQWKACYWKNDSIHLLDDHYSVANDIVVVDKEIIAAGKYNGKPCLWKGGKRIMLDSEKDGEVKAIGVHDGVLHLVGQLYETQTNFRAFEWAEGKMTFLNDYKGYASDIDFEGQDIYISGMDAEKPCFWKNGKKTVLSESFGHGYGIEVVGHDVFVGGEYRPTNGGYFLSGYWKNGLFQSSGGNDCYVWNIGVDRGEVFLVGNAALTQQQDVAMLIAGEGKMALSTPDQGFSGAVDIAFSLNNRYILGICKELASDKQNQYVCYWLNNKRHQVTKDKSLGMGIYLNPQK